MFSQGDSWAIGTDRDVYLVSKTSLPAVCPWPHACVCEAEKRGSMENTELGDGGAEEWDDWNTANKVKGEKFLKDGGKRVNVGKAIGLQMVEVSYVD